MAASGVEEEDKNEQHDSADGQIDVEVGCIGLNVNNCSLDSGDNVPPTP
jgi:hypothetical protein